MMFWSTYRLTNQSYSCDLSIKKVDTSSLKNGVLYGVVKRVVRQRNTFVIDFAVSMCIDIMREKRMRSSFTRVTEKMGIAISRPGSDDVLKAHSTLSSTVAPGMCNSGDSMHAQYHLIQLFYL